MYGWTRGHYRRFWRRHPGVIVIVPYPHWGPHWGPRW